MQNERDVEFTPDPGLDRIEEEPDRTGGAGMSGNRQNTDFQRASGTTSPGSASGRDRVTPAGALPPGDDERSTGQKAKAAASDLGHRATEQVEEQLETRKHRAADQLSGVAQALRSAGEQIPSDNQMGGYISKAATQVDNLASFLDNQDLTDLVNEAQDLARRQPAAFIGGAFALGMIGGRFLRSSREELVDRGAREGWDADRMTARIRNPEEDGVGRPDAPGYIAPSERGRQSGAGEGGFR